jgi:hypothetical protein
MSKRSPDGAQRQRIIITVQVARKRREESGSDVVAGTRSRHQSAIEWFVGDGES